MASRRPLPLLVSICCPVVAALPASYETNPSCLLQLQTHRQKLPIKASQGQTSDEGDTVHVHSIDAEPSHVIPSSQRAAAFYEVLGAAGKTNGPADMQKTRMAQDNLPEDVRHVDKETWTSDWSSEYPPFVRSVAPSTPKRPSVPPSTPKRRTPAAAAAWPHWLLLLADKEYFTWLFLLASWCWLFQLLGCLIMIIPICCLTCCAVGRRSKQDVDQSVSRQIITGPVNVSSHHVFVSRHDELQALPPQLQGNQHSNTILHPPATGSDGHRPDAELGLPPATGGFMLSRRWSQLRDLIRPLMAQSARQVDREVDMAAAGVESTGHECDEKEVDQPASRQIISAPAKLLPDHVFLPVHDEQCLASQTPPPRPPAIEGASTISYPPATGSYRYRPSAELLAQSVQHIMAQSAQHLSREVPMATVGVDSTGDGHARQIISAPVNGPPHRVFVPVHDELDLSQKTLPPQPQATQHASAILHPPKTGSYAYRPGAELVPPPSRSPLWIPHLMTQSMQQISREVHMATVAVDSTGDGRANYLYSGIDRNSDGIPDSLQVPHVNRQIPTATVAVAANADGRANYLYTGVDRNRDGIPGSLQVPHVNRQIPTATVAVDSTGDGRANYLFTGVDRNRDGIPVSLQSTQVGQGAWAALSTLVRPGVQQADVTEYQ